MTETETDTASATPVGGGGGSDNDGGAPAGKVRRELHTSITGLVLQSAAIPAITTSNSAKKREATDAALPFRGLSKREAVPDSEGASEYKEWLFRGIRRLEDLKRRAPTTGPSPLTMYANTI